jgi:hypothetical protein
MASWQREKDRNGCDAFCVPASQAHIPSAPTVDIAHVFNGFESYDLELLDVFLADAEIVETSRFGAQLPNLGKRPALTIDRRWPGGGGEGRIHTTSVSAPVRREVFAALRKLRTESNWASIAAARNLLHHRLSGAESLQVSQLAAWLRDVKRWIRDANYGEPLVSFRVRDERGERSYDTTGKVLNLVQNGSEFHNERALRRDLKAFPELLVDPVVDDGLRQIAEVTIALASVARRVLAEPGLHLR